MPDAFNVVKLPLACTSQERRTIPSIWRQHHPEFLLAEQVACQGMEVSIACDKDRLVIVWELDHRPQDKISVNIALRNLTLRMNYGLELQLVPGNIQPGVQRSLRWQVADEVKRSVNIVLSGQVLPKLRKIQFPAQVSYAGVEILPIDERIVVQRIT
jgi:hypothetical protein